VIDAAVHAPNAVNQRPGAFTVIHDQRLFDRISRDAKDPMFASMPAGPQFDPFRSLLNDPGFQIFYRASAVILISRRPRCDAGLRSRRVGG
jgi:nitroreductase